MTPSKPPATPGRGNAGGSHENRKHPEKPKSRGKPSAREVTADNAREREQNKRMPGANVDQQGDRANVRQNTTRQGNRRSA
jgi:hypothetical protein